jgi:hypothetical protein
MKIRDTGQDLQTVIADLKQHVWDSSAMPPVKRKRKRKAGK